jgi:3-isopropylmalate/(R)-2-methylmalate dehydratase large subunit
MGMTLAEKILARSSNSTSVRPGDIVWAKVQTAMMDDILGPRIEIAEKFKKLNVPIWDRQKVVVIIDHYSPAANVKQAEIIKFTRDWAIANQVRYYEGEGPCHQLLAEKGYNVPGTVVVGTDSHTCTSGAFGAFGTGIGSTEMIGVLATGEIWLKVPESIRINWQGKLPQGVYAKDIALKTIGDIGLAGATYMALEFTGSTIHALPLDERLCITNLAVEAGAKTGLIEPDEIMSKWVKEHNIEDYALLTSDPDANYRLVKNYDAEALIPQVACPHNVDNVRNVIAMEKTPINQAYVGSCTGGRFEDLVAAEKVIRNRKIAPGIRFYISPASSEIYNRALEAGLLKSFVEAGAHILPPTCGICLGLHSGILASGERCISSTNRNFIGRMGSREAEIYLGSAATVAASALAGYIADPREYLQGGAL